MMTFGKHYRGIEAKGNDIDILDLREIDSAVFVFVICKNSNTQVNAIVNSIQKVVSKEIKDKPWHVEDLTMRNGAYIINISSRVSKQIREYYNIESLWEMQNYHNKTNYQQNGKRK
jgi:ribosome-associated protein